MTAPQHINDLQKYSLDTGSRDVSVQDQSTEIVDLLLNLKLDDLTILSGTTLYDQTIDIETTGYVPAAGDVICLKEGFSFYQGAVLSVTPIAGNQYTLGLDTPLDFAFSTSGGCSIGTANLAVDGSVTPQIFKVSPTLMDASIQWDICRMIISMTHTAAPNDGTFGGIAALTNGIFFRKVNGTIKNGFNAKTNGDFALRAYDVTYASAPPQGLEGTRIRRSFNGPDKNGVTIRLANSAVPEDADQFQCIVQDNLTGLTSFQIVVQGHVVSD